MTALHLQLDRLKQLVGQEDKQWRPFLIDFAQELQQMQMALKNAKINKNWSKIGQLLHQLKSNLHLFGCLEAYQMAQDLEAFTQLKSPKMSLFIESFQDFLSLLKSIELEAENWPK
ncbi:Hpt domain-containing protein [Saprospira grandis]|uniref:HPt domain-containing protein n=1 Tax=Saprospira grandis (strain Lewin) TaxID=984262 RepID=H6LB03_SAPGL|nr:Hpt domain-containing protein [Saprospira grandis]AFC26968.1 hypothetical protein SGRA_p0028 [Saprospira grandis str. Lewin]